MAVQQWGQPCAAGDLVHFRKRIGESGVEKIFGHSIEKHGKDAKDPNVSIDTTAQEKNITYPTDAKLHKKIVGQMREDRKREQYRPSKELQAHRETIGQGRLQRQTPQEKEKGRCPKRKLKTIAGRSVGELERKLPQGACTGELELYKKVLAQESNGKNKIYSLHEPEVYCMAKGKAHKNTNTATRPRWCLPKERG